MDENELQRHTMTMPEEEKWDMMKRKIIEDCQFLQIPLSFGEKIEKATNAVEAFHKAGYCEKTGYYYISYGDRGGIASSCISKNPDNVRWYILEQIVVAVGQRMELNIRSAEEQNWRYKREFEDGKQVFNENKNWTYNTIHDTRKFWFEYAIKSLYKIFGRKRLSPYVRERIGNMNWWFDPPHWDFDWQNMCFIEISDSQEHD